jgi:hypothetical protein
MGDGEDAAQQPSPQQHLAPVKNATMDVSLKTVWKA